MAQTGINKKCLFEHKPGIAKTSRLKGEQLLCVQRMPPLPPMAEITSWGSSSAASDLATSNGTGICCKNVCEFACEEESNVNIRSCPKDVE